VTLRVAVVARRTVDADPARLTVAERGALAQVRGARRRDEWIRGRLAMRRLLSDPDTSVVVADDGAPQPTGGRPCSVSLSHDGEWIAVAVASASLRLGIDLCVRCHAARLPRILRWLDVAYGALDPVTVWTALEAALKLRGLAIEALRDRALEVEAAPAHERSVIVRGLGADLHVRTRATRDFVVGWAVEAR
jgi:phosphopantetheinyl transferase